MGSCCSSLSTRDVLAMLSAKLPSEPSRKAQRDQLFKKAVEINQIEALGSRHCTAPSLAAALEALYRTHKMSGEVSVVCEHLAVPSALRYGMGRLNFKERRQRGGEEGQHEEEPRSNLLRYELRYCLAYILGYFRIKAILEEAAGMRWVADARTATVDAFSFRVARGALESELHVRCPPGWFETIGRETAMAASRPVPKSDEPILLMSLVEHCIATVFYDEMTEEDEPRAVPAPGAADALGGGVGTPPASALAQSTTPPATALSPAPPKSPVAVTTGSRQFGALLQEAEEKERRASPAVTTLERSPPTAEPLDAPARSEQQQQPSVPRAESVASSIRGSSRGRRSSSLPTPTVAIGSHTTRSAYDMWMSARSMVPLGVDDDDVCQREELFERFDTKKRQRLDEMDVFQGAQAQLLLRDVFPNGGLVVSQAVSSAFLAALHRLPSGGAASGGASSGSTSESITTESRFHVFLATLVALLDLHFDLKRRVLVQESLRHADQRAAKAAAVAAQTHQRGPQAPNPLNGSGGGTSPATPAGLTTPATSETPPAAGGIHVSLFEQNRIYQQTVGSIPLDHLLDALIAGTVVATTGTPTSPEKGRVEADGVASSSASSALTNVRPLLLPLAVLERSRVTAMVEQLLLSIRHASVGGGGGASSPTNAATAVQRISFEKMGPRIGVFVCDALYHPPVPADVKKPLFALGDDAVAAREALRQQLVAASAEEEQAFASATEAQRHQPLDTAAGVSLASALCLVRVCALHDVTPNASLVVRTAYLEACLFEHTVRRAALSVQRPGVVAFPRNAVEASGDGNEEVGDNGNDCCEDQTLFTDPTAWHRLLSRIYTSLAVVSSMEVARQPPLHDLNSVAAVDLNADVSIKEWGHVCRTAMETLGLRKALGPDPFLVLHGLRKSCDDDVATTRAVCRWAAEQTIRLLLAPSARPTRQAWYHVLTSRLPSALVDAEESRCYALFIRLTTGPRSVSPSAGASADAAAAMPSGRLAAGLREAYQLDSLFLSEDVGCEGLWDALVEDAVNASDAVAARRPCLVEEGTFRACLVFLQAAMACYFTVEHFLLPPLAGHAKRVPVNLTTLAVRKEVFRKVVDAMHIAVDAVDDEFASLANGQATARLQYLAHFAGLMDQRKLPVNKANVWKRLSPLLLRLINDEAQRKKFFAFEIQKEHPSHCTTLELQRVIGKDWSLDVLINRSVSVASLLRDAVGVACSTKYPPVKDNTLVTPDCMAPFLIFLHAYIDVGVETEALMRDIRTRRRSSMSSTASLRIDEASFILLEPVFARNGVSLPATMAAHASPSGDAAGDTSGDNIGSSSRKALADVFEVLARGGNACTADAVAHWAAHAAVRTRYSLSGGLRQNGSEQRLSRGNSVSGGDVGGKSPNDRVSAAHPSSPWTQLRVRLPVGTDARQTQRRATFFQQVDVTRRRSYVTLKEMLDGAEGILGMDAFHVELEPVVYRASTAAKDALKAHLSDNGRDLDMARVSPQYVKGVQEALACTGVTPLEFRLVLLYMYQYLELYYMFDRLMLLGAGADVSKKTPTTSDDTPNAQQPKVPHPPGSKAMGVEAAEGGAPAATKEAVAACKQSKQITYQSFLLGAELLTSWGLDPDALQEPDVLFRRINGGRDGVLLFTDFAIWASKEQLHVEDPTFPQLSQQQQQP